MKCQLILFTFHVWIKMKICYLWKSINLEDCSWDFRCSLQSTRLKNPYILPSFILISVLLSCHHTYISHLLHLVCPSVLYPVYLPTIAKNFAKLLDALRGLTDGKTYYFWSEWVRFNKMWNTLVFITALAW